MQRQAAFEWMTRLGFAARGLVYILVGLMVVLAGRAEDAAGVFQLLAGGTGKWLLIAMAAGFAAYGLWRLADAALGIESKGDDKEALKRVAAGLSGAVHLYLAKQSLDVASGAAAVAGDVTDAPTSAVLDLPAGQLILALIALGLVAAGIFQLVIAARCTFLCDLDHSVRESWVKWLGRAGYAARGAVFLIAGYFLATAAVRSRSSSAGGMEQVLEWLSSPTDAILAAGLLLFGIYALVEAWHRRIRAPDPVALAGRAAEQLR